MPHTHEPAMHYSVMLDTGWTATHAVQLLSKPKKSSLVVMHNMRCRPSILFEHMLPHTSQ